MRRLPALLGTASFAWVDCSLLLVLAASFFPIWAASHNLGERNDDAYITLTYAKSLAAGHGWRYNGGSEALGTTTPLFALVVAGLARLLPALPLEYLAVGWSTLCWLATGWLLYGGHRALGLRREAGALVAAIVLLQAGWWLPTLGMEATFLLLGLTLATWLTARDHAFASGFVSALLFLIRPEGLAMVPLAGLWLLWQGRGAGQRDRLARFGVGALLPLLAWGLYAGRVFGSVLPNSASAKVSQGAFWPGRSFAVRLLREWLPPIAARYGVSPWLSLLWPLVGLGLYDSVRRVRPLLLLPLWTVLFVATYAALHAPGYWWYMLPVLYVLVLCAAVGASVLVHQPGRGRRGAGVVAALLLLGLTLWQGVESVRQSRGDPRAPTYLAAARWLAAHSASGSSVAFVEIGYLGYFTENRIVDLVGLVEPAFTANGARLDLASNFWLAEPDYLLYAPDFGWLMGPIVEDPRFARRYRLVAELPSHFTTPFFVYQRLAAPNPLTPPD